MTNITGRIIAMGPVVMGTNEEGKNWFTQEVLLRGTGAKVTRLAFGLPADSGIAYSDPLTLKRAITNRIAQ